MKSLPSIVRTSFTRNSRTVRSRFLSPGGSAACPPGGSAFFEVPFATPTAATPPTTVSTTSRIQITALTIYEYAVINQRQSAMPVMNIIEAVRSALQLQMRADQRVVVLGEDIGKFGGVFRATSGLYDEFGADRVIDTPLAEAGIIGAAIGMSLYGLRPVPEIQFGDFIFPAFDQIVNELAKFRYRSGGQYACPVVIRTPVGGGIRGGHYHSQSPEALFIHTPGLKVVAPSNPYDAKGLLLAAMRQNDPVLFMEPKRIYRASRGDVPDGEYTVELGKAAIVRPGSQVTVVAWSGMV